MTTDFLTTMNHPLATIYYQDIQAASFGDQTLQQALCVSYLEHCSATSIIHYKHKLDIDRQEQQLAFDKQENEKTRQQKERQHIQAIKAMREEPNWREMLDQAQREGHSSICTLVFHTLSTTLAARVAHFLYQTHQGGILGAATAMKSYVLDYDCPVPTELGWYDYMWQAGGLLSSLEHMGCIGGQIFYKVTNGVFFVAFFLVSHYTLPWHTKCVADVVLACVAAVAVDAAIVSALGKVIGLLTLAAIFFGVYLGKMHLKAYKQWNNDDKSLLPTKKQVANEICDFHQISNIICIVSAVIVILDLFACLVLGM